jgi:hypothetical protein
VSEKVALAGFVLVGDEMSPRSDGARLLRKIALVSCGVIFFTGFFSKLALDAYFIDWRPREPKPVEGRIYPKYIISTGPYRATVYLTRKEKALSDMLIPFSFIMFGIGYGLNARWKLLAPYKES